MNVEEKKKIQRAFRGSYYLSCQFTELVVTISISFPIYSTRKLISKLNTPRERERAKEKGGA